MTISNLLTQTTDKPWVVLLMLNVVLLMIGCFMEIIAIMIILVPILIPVLNLYHIDLTHFGIILLINLTVGQLTPPVGVLLFVSSAVAKVRFADVAYEAMPYVGVLLLTLAVLTYVSEVSMWLPLALK